MIIDQKIIDNIDEFAYFIAEHKIGFFDFGCSHGAGALWVQSMLGTRGIGFDIDPKKLDLADSKGLICCNYDILKLKQEKLVPLVTIFHMLEHLQNVSEAKKFIFAACKISSNNVIIKQPYFDSDPMLFHMGLKTYYSHWSGHSNQMTTPDFYFILNDLRTKNIIKEFIIGYKKSIESSDSDIIHPLSSPFNSHQYDPVEHPSKPSGIKFNFPVFYEIQIAIDVGGDSVSNLWNKLSPDYIAYDSRNGKHHNPFEQ